MDAPSRSTTRSPSRRAVSQARFPRPRLVAHGAASWLAAFWLTVSWITVQTTGVVAANEVVQTAVDGKLITVEGRILVEAQDGGLLLEEPSGRQWTLEPQDYSHAQ